MKISAGTFRAMIVAIFWTFQFANAEESVTDFNMVLNVAVENSPAIKEVRREISEYQAESEALKLQNPELSGEVRPFTKHESETEEEYEIALEQALRPSDFGARQRVVSVLSGLKDIESKLLFLRFEKELLLAYGKAWALQERANYLEQLYKESEKLSRNFESAAASGLIQGSAKLLILAEQKKLKADLHGVRADREQSIAELFRLSGQEIKSGKLAELNYAKLPEQIVLDNNIPLVKRIELRSDLAEAQARKASLDSFPHFTPKIAFDHTADGDDRLIAGITFSLPLFDRNLSERTKAEADREVQMTLKKYMQDGFLQKEVDLLLRSAQNSERQATELRSEVLPALQHAYQQSLKEFSAGQGTAVNLWQILNEQDEAQLRFLELWIQSLSRRCELSVLSGINF